MKNNSIFCFVASVVVAVSLIGGARAQTTKPDLDREVSEGILPNGMRYLIRPTTLGNPNSGANVQLVVNVGSLDEADDEQGYAHFVEHLAFRKTKRTRDGEIISFVRGLGGNFGQHINAFTNLQRTQYWLTLPPDKISSLPNAIKIIAEWTNKIEFSDEIIDIERGVVKSEKRSRDLSGLPADKINAAMLDRGLYRRNIAGTDATLTTANAQRLKSFYEKHYTPERMTVVLSGWLPEGTRYWIQKLSDEMGSVEVKSSPITLPRRPVFETSPQIRVVQTDNAQLNTVGLISYAPQSSPSNANQLRQLHLRSLSTRLLNQHLATTLTSPAWIIGTAVSDTQITANMRTFQVALNLQDIKYADEARDTLLKAISQFVTSGISQVEIDRVKSNFISSLKISETEGERSNSGSVGFNLASYAFSDGFYISRRDFRALSEQVLANVTITDIADQIKQRFASEDLLWVVLSQRGAEKPQADETALKENSATWLANLKLATAETRPVLETALANRPVPILRSPEPAGTIVKEESQEGGIKRWVLSNGAIVYLKPVTSSVDQVLLTARRLYGLWSVDQNDIPASRMALRGGWISDGVGPFSAGELQRQIASRSLGFNVSLGETKTIVAASGPSAGLEFGSHLVHEFFRAMRPNQASFNRLKARAENDLTLANPSPQQRFENDWRLTLREPNLWLSPLSSLQVTQVKASQLQVLHQQVFGDASQWVFTFTGNISTRDIRRITEIYLASLPSKATAVGTANAPIQWAQTAQLKQGQRVETKGALAERTLLRVQYFNPAIKHDMFQDVIAVHLQEALMERLRLVLRTNSGLTYSPTANIQFLEGPDKGALITVNVDTSPQDVGRVESLVKGTVQTLVTIALSEAEMTAVAQVEKASNNVNQSNYIWMANILQVGHQRGESLEGYNHARAKVAELRAAGLQSEFTKWLSNIMPSVGILSPN